MRRIVVLLLGILLLQGAPPARSASSTVLIRAVYYDAQLTNEPSEAVQLMNVSASAVDLDGWQLTDQEGTVTFPASRISER